MGHFLFWLDFDVVVFTEMRTRAFVPRIGVQRTTFAEAPWEQLHFATIPRLLNWGAGDPWSPATLQARPFSCVKMRKTFCTSSHNSKCAADFFPRRHAQSTGSRRNRSGLGRFALTCAAFAEEDSNQRGVHVRAFAFVRPRLRQDSFVYHRQRT